jgi:AcrR family transcriptional regulator
MKDKRRQILAAARRVSAKEGFQGATMQKIAAEAGLKSPSHIYWYFKNKKELFQSMMEELSPLLSQMPNMWSRIDDPPEEVLFPIGMAYIHTFDNPEVRQLLRIFFSELTRTPEIINNFAEKALLLLSFLIAYLERQIELGRLRPHNTQSSARAFIGAFVVYMLANELLIPLRTGIPAPDDYAREVIETLLRGLRPDTDKK